MKAFEYATAHSSASARELVAGNGAYLAGGNDLLGLLKEYLVSANILVNIKSLPGLNKIEHGKTFWTIGSLVTVAQIENDADIQKTFPGLQEAASEIASLWRMAMIDFGSAGSATCGCNSSCHQPTSCHLPIL